MAPAPDLEIEGERLCRRLGGRWTNGQGLCLCPAHNDHDPSLSIRVGHRALLFKCFAGCDTISVLRAIRRLRLPLPQSTLEAPYPHAASTEKRPGPALRLWDASVPLIGTSAEAYLSGRLLQPPWQDLRYKARAPLGRGRDVVFRPALIAAVRERHRIVAVHRSFLDPLSVSLAKDLTNPRMMLGRPGRGAVQLAPANDILGLAEGIETALAAMRLHRLPVWATLGAERAGHILLPGSLERLVLLFDRDAAGWSAHQRALEAYARPHLDIRSIWPSTGHNDWADVLATRLRAAGGAANERRPPRVPRRGGSEPVSR
ncbi:toprim domain-containing protein [Sphingobium yanoikuyae]|uniref:Toprim domain-containing protein n=1 Tax=Sphingobium yanoikuyae TaxID=13690 RepID=A0AA42WSQ4_SPHYA|nr:toprim domain-containing protein [Sphingobium yanoikuyae]MDH2129547.1 toprim domain-containing protein [Sphingobium yanoikuyae]MDH2149024.1 toprim domain-containing protein [Sphingobium yanoikuyae]MDH2167670.1 toprim domain-containing protein [Sphingobium yanoikuyae]